MDDWCIAQACGISIRETFPLVAYSKILGVAAIAAIPAIWIKIGLDLGPATMLGLEAAALLLVYAVLGTAFGLIGRDDWAYLGRWLRLRLGTG